MNNSDVITVAKTYRDYFVTGMRSGETFLRLSKEAPPLLKDVVEEAHGDFSPDDYRYQYIEDAITTLAEAEDYRDSGDLEDLYQWIDADTDLPSLLKWFGSNAKRVKYVDAARKRETSGTFESVTDMLRAGQQLEREDIFLTVLNSLCTHTQNT